MPQHCSLRWREGSTGAGVRRLHSAACYPQRRAVIYDGMFYVAGMILPEVRPLPQGGRLELPSADRQLGNKEEPFEFSGKSHQESPTAKRETGLSLGTHYNCPRITTGRCLRCP